MLKKDSKLIFTISGKEIQANRPEPFNPDIELIPYNHQMETRKAVEALFDGNYVLISDLYSSGLTILRELKNYIKSKHTDQSFKGQRDFRSLFRELSHRLLLPVNNNKLAVKKGPEIGWLKILYPDLNEFLLPFPQVQGLNSSWQWYKKGILIPVLTKRIHPFFGTYFPTRFEHLELFDNWLKNYNGEKRSAIDIGIGCGVLSFQMLKYRFEKIYGTDSNPNAIIGLNREQSKNKMYSNIELFHGDLFANCNFKTELIVFNPPWLPASFNLEGLDKAIYYEADLFTRFFSEAENHLKPGGRIVILFSNLAQITKVTDNHPIKAELSGGGRFRKELFTKKKVNPASKNTRRDQNWRTSELTELWVLKK